MPQQKSLQQPQDSPNLPPHPEEGAELLALNQQLLEQSRLLQQAQQRIAELEEKISFFDSLIQYLPNPIFVKEANELRFVSWNKASEKLFGLKQEQVLGKNDYDFFPKQEADFFTSKDRQVLAGNQVLDIPEEPIHTPDRGSRLLHTRKVPILGANGQPKFLLGISEDITERKQAEEALRISEARHRALAEAMPDLMIRMRRDGTYLDFQAPRDFKTYKPATDFVDKNVVEMLPPELAQQRLDYTSQALLTGQPQIFEYTLPYADGLHYQEARIVPSGPDEVLTIIRDVTDRKWAEESLRKSEARNRALLNAFPDLIMRLHRDGTYLDIKPAKDVNPVAPPSELLGKKVSEVLPPEMAERRLHTIAQALQTGQPQVSEQQLLRDNQLHDEEVRVVASGEDEVLVIVRDITERKQAERQLRQNQALLQAIIDNTAASIYVLDAQGRFLLINNTFADLFKLDKQAVIGKTDYDLFPHDAAEDYQSGDLEILKAGLPVQVEEHVPREDGMHTYVTLKFPLFDELGQPFALCGMSTDITERKHTEENLVKRATELETVAEVSTAVSTVLETEMLLQLVVDLAKSRFNLYHAHIYLLNQQGDTLVLTAATGEAGQKMLEQGWQIPLSREQSLVARAARTRQGVIANNVRSRLDFLANPLLPETQAEMAVPIISGSHMLGVLDVQSDQLDYFTDEDVRVQSVLADQVAAGIQNARLFQEIQLALNETEALNRIARALGQLNNIRALAEIALVEYLYILNLPQGGVLLFDEDKTNGTLIALVQQYRLVEPGLRLPIAGNPSYEQLLARKEPVLIKDALQDPLLEPVRDQVHQLNIKSLLLVPIITRNEVIGALGADSTETIHEFTPREIALVQSVADQLGVAIENRRLLEEAQARARREQVLREATTRIRSAVDTEAIMRAAVEEVGRALDRPAFIYLGQNQQQPGLPSIVEPGLEVTAK